MTDVATSGGSSTDPTPARSRRSGSEVRARSHLINVRLNDDERRRWTAFAERQGKPLAGLLRELMETALLLDQMQETETRDA